MPKRTTGGTWRERGGRAAAVLVLVGVPTALVGGVASCVASDMGHLPGDAMERVRETPYDKTAAAYGHRAWAVGDTVVRSRFDAVTAFDARTGERRWEHAVPGRAEICATSDAADSVALVGPMEPLEAQEAAGAGDGEGCSTVAAIDLRNGRELWRTGRLPGGGDPKDGDDVLATGAGLAVVRDEGGQGERGTGPAHAAPPARRPGGAGLRPADRRPALEGRRAGGLPPRRSRRLPEAGPGAAGLRHPGRARRLRPGRRHGAVDRSARRPPPRRPGARGRRRRLCTREGAARRSSPTPGSIPTSAPSTTPLRVRPRLPHPSAKADR
ncbi:PQQ-binding-like beta-propeller repeat protein [Streptomyces sp.]|uniref:PQQ-binding-like beta-propeller repeat protein n=1 Tax=Streptomyces sp. TaxID=1931 RepID=UPI002811338B|nr:PQQ-binding-like beta-propeller repeat protein [Streptomyces sp.]